MTNGKGKYHHSSIPPTLHSPSLSLSPPLSPIAQPQLCSRPARRPPSGTFPRRAEPNVNPPRREILQRVVRMFTTQHSDADATVATGNGKPRSCRTFQKSHFGKRVKSGFTRGSVQTNEKGEPYPMNKLVLIILLLLLLLLLLLPIKRTSIWNIKLCCTKGNKRCRPK